MENLFLVALRKKYRFNTPKGMLNMEQLFDLSDVELDSVYRGYESSIDTTKGLLGKKGNSESKEKLKIVEAIYDYKRTEAEENAVKANNLELRAKLLTIAENRKFDELTEGKTSEEIIKMARKL